MNENQPHNDELDSVLKKLGQIGREGDSFADQVMAEKTRRDNHSIEDPLRLPVPVPTHADPLDQTVDSDLVASPVSRSKASLAAFSFIGLISVTAVALLVVVAAWPTIAAWFNPERSMDSVAEFDPVPDLQPKQDHPEVTLPTNRSSAASRTSGMEPSAVPFETDRPSDAPRDPENRPKTQLFQPQLAAGNPSQPAEPVSDFDWELSIDFDIYGIGTIAVNGEKLPNAVFQENLRPLLHTMTHQAVDRFAYLQPNLKRTMRGALTLGDQTFGFADSDSLDAAIAAAMDHLSGRKFEIFDHDDLMERRSATLEHLPASEPESATAAASLEFATPDEVSLVNATVEATDKVLHQLVMAQQLNKHADEPGQAAPVVPQTADPKSDLPTIDPEAFTRFLHSGSLPIPLTQMNPPTVAPLMQPLGGDALKRQLLQLARPVDLFRTRKEYVQANRFINTQQTGFLVLGMPPEKSIDALRNSVNRAKILLQRDPDDALKQRRFNEVLAEFNQVKDNAAAQSRQPTMEPLKQILPQRSDLQGLPIVMGEECIMEDNDAQTLDFVSKAVGRTLGLFDRFGSRDTANNDSWRNSIVKQEMELCKSFGNRDQTLTTLDQILQVDHPQLRVELINSLKQSTSEIAMDRIVCRAKYDLVPEVRVRATEALKEYPADAVRAQLLDGFRYPWPTVAMHSAEALVRLNDQGAVSELIEMLDDADPRIPTENEQGTLVSRELVAINHMRNCLLCHAPSSSLRDYGRAATPTLEQPVPQQYYAAPRNPNEGYVRADVVYLKQDFSVQHEIENSGPWPKNQRVDYVVQERRVGQGEARLMTSRIQNEPNLHREAIVFALQKLTGKTPVDNSKASWLAVAQRLE